MWKNNQIAHRKQDDCDHCEVIEPPCEEYLMQFFQTEDQSHELFVITRFG